MFEHSFPRSAKSAERIDGAMIAGGDILEVVGGIFMDLASKLFSCFLAVSERLGICKVN